METIVLRAHFDGENILLDEPHELHPGASLLITVIDEPDEERNAWYEFAAQNLGAAYSDDEPEYSLALIKESNPNYETR